MALNDYLQQRLKRRSPLLMTHAVAGCPSLAANWRMLELMDEAGVDLVELQFPFSEPIADGPLFIRANQQALEQGLHRDQYFEFMARARQAFSFRLLFMGYYNNVYRLGHEAFCRRLAEAGADGFIIADLPPQLGGDLETRAARHHLDVIHLMTPNNTDARLNEIAQGAGGFVYCVARRGVTGRSTELDNSIRDYLQRCRKATTLPLAVGFGIRSAAQVKQLQGVADIAIVGTACLDVWEREGEKGYLRFLKKMTSI